MSYDRLAGRLYNTPLLITPEKAAIIEAVFRSHVEGYAPTTQPRVEEHRPAIELASASSMRRTDGGYYMNTAGIAVVQIHGSLVQRGDGMDAMSGLTGYNRIAGQVSAAMRDPNVRGVVLEIDSPGGEVPGLMELASVVTGADKPIWAHANELAASAAYWLGAAAAKLFAPTTGMVGSIGVLMMHVDRSRAIERAGITYTPIFAGARKLEGSSIAPLSEEARSSAQSRVDQVYGMFVEHVARYRKMKEQAVRDTEAGMFSVQDAIDMQLADGIATLGDVVQMMTDELNSGRLGNSHTFGRAAVNAQSTSTGDVMSDANKAAPAVSAVITQEQLDAARAAGVTEGKAAAISEAQSTATKAAAERIKAIQSSDAGKTRPALASHLAFETEMSAESAIALLAKAAPETKPEANPLNAALAGTNPRVGPDGEHAQSEGAPRVVETAQSIYDRRAQQMHIVK